ncbi:MAG: FtsX-like permease family protein [Gordonibacter sp.]
MTRAFRKDIWRAIVRGRKRFLSILVITALGVTMLTGLQVACIDLRASADQFFDDQKLFDLSVQSTLGLTQDDVSSLAALDGVDEAVGAYEETAYVQVDGKRRSVDVKALNAAGINEPYVVQGSLPERAGEVVVTEGYLKDSGKSIGDTVEFEGGAASPAKEGSADDAAAEGNAPDDADALVFERRAYTIVGVVVDPANIANPDGPAAFRSATASDYTFFVDEDAARADVFTAAYLTLAGGRELVCYSDAYDKLVASVQGEIEGIKGAREQARSNDVKAEAQAKLDDAEREAQAEFADAEAKLADAQKTLDESRQMLADGRAQLDAQRAAAASQLAAAQQQIDDGYAQLQAGASQLDESAAQVAQGMSQLEAGKAQLKATQEQTDLQFSQQRAALVAAGAPAEQIAALDAQRAAATAAFGQQWDGIAAQESQLQAAQQQVDAGRAQLADKRAPLDAGAAQLPAQRQSAEDQLAAAEQQLTDGEAQLAAGQAELDAQRQTYLDERAKAEAKLSDARADVAAIENALWYVQDRTSLGSYASIDSDASSVEAVGTAFPIVFFIVAILISLTTVTRMVEEERGLIGTYKALGLRNREILAKYVVYALSACLIGGVIGDVLGFVGLPEFVFSIFTTMYVLPDYVLQFDLLYGLGGIALFTFGIVGSTVFACRSELKQTPAALMRPKAPRRGSRIFLERIGPVWKKLSFLGKVTARNLFRYKKRLFMTVSGIMGCTALLVCGFAINDSVSYLGPQQYSHVYSYDLMAVTAPGDFEEVADDLRSDGDVEDFEAVRIDSVSVKYDGAEESMQLVVVPRGETLDGYIALEDAAGAPVELGDDEILITRNAAQVLGFAEGDEVTLKDTSLAEHAAPIDRIVENYLGNVVYMGQGAYERLFGTYEPNGLFAHLSADDQVAFADDLARRDGVLSTASTQELRDNFASSFSLVSSVVYLITAMAAALAFVVLFTLSTTNISERERELATIKVLGFRKGEVHHYVNRETLILTGFGIALGLPLGHMLGNLLTVALNMPSIYFAVHIEWTSYLLAAALAFVFALVVNLITNRSLDHINMVEALKSVE